MAHQITETLSIKGQLPSKGVLGPLLVSRTDTMPLAFTFDLWHKPVLLGEVPFEHYWMALNAIYGQRGQKGRNHESIIAYFWALCVVHDTWQDDDVLDSYVLAHLAPRVRSNGGRNVFADSRPRRRAGEQVSQQDMILELNNCLKQSRHEELTKVQFHQATGNLLGPPAYGDEVFKCYTNFEDQLLAPVRVAIVQQNSGAIELAVTKWDQWMRQIGRRSGNKVQKQVLDVFSYECRTALHRCYSAVWFDLIQRLANQDEWTEECVLFHRLWHLDLIDTVDSQAIALPNNRLFHGHIFALHPACSNFIQTLTGQELLGTYLRDPSCQPSFQRLLHGLFVAMHDYASRNDIYRSMRRNSPQSQDGRELDQLDANDRTRRH